MLEFRWNAWNIAHIGEHGISPAEAEYVAGQSPRGYPRRARGDAYLVRGKTPGGDYIQVAYIIDPPPLTTVYVIHARPLSDAEKRRYFPKRRRP